MKSISTDVLCDWSHANQEDFYSHGEEHVKKL